MNCEHANLPGVDCARCNSAVKNTSEALSVIDSTIRVQALQYLIRERIVHSPEAFLSFGAALELTPSLNREHVELANYFLDQVYQALPGKLREPERAQPTDDVMGFTFGQNETITVIATPAITHTGELKVNVTGVLPITTDLIEPSSTNPATLHFLNELNSSLDEIVFVYHEALDSVIAYTSLTIPSSAVGSYAAESVSQILVDFAAATLHLHTEAGINNDLNDASILSQRSSRLLASASDERWTYEELRRAILEYKNTILSPDVTDLLLVNTDNEEDFSLTFPLPSTEGPLAAQVTLSLGQSRDSRGIRIFARMPAELSQIDALQLVHRFNTGDTSTEVMHNTTSWTSGAWFTREIAPGRNLLMYSGFTPHTYRNFYPLPEEIDGVIREVTSTWRRYQLHADFKTAVGGL